MGLKIKKDIITPLGKMVEDLDGTAKTIHLGIFDSSLSTIGSYHEFGTRTIPQRSFLRAWMTIYGKDLTERIKNGIINTMASNPDISALEGVYSSVGNWAVLSIKNRILRTIPPSLSAATVEQKEGRYKLVPLVNRGHLLNSITFRVVKTS